MVYPIAEASHAIIAHMHRYYPLLPCYIGALYRLLHPTPREAFMLPIASLSDFILSQCMTP